MTINMISFKQLLAESLEPKQIEFGTDFLNGKFEEKQNSNLLVTFFMFDNVKCKVLYYFDDGSFAFSVYSEKQKKWIMHHTSSDVSIKNMIKFYDSILFILVKMIEQYKNKIHRISFEPSVPRLKTIYNRIYNSPQISSIIKSLGLVKKMSGDTYIFEKPKASIFNIFRKK